MFTVSLKGISYHGDIGTFDTLEKALSFCKYGYGIQSIETLMRMSNDIVEIRDKNDVLILGFKHSPIHSARIWRSTNKEEE